MKLEGEYDFEASVQDVWDALFDPAVLAAALPGCDKLELVDGAYLGELKVKVGPVQGKFSGKVDLLDQVAPRSYRMVIDGRGQQGFVKANATIELAEVAGSGGAKTRLRYVSDAQIGGKLATVGMRLVEASAKAIVKQSLEGLHENVKIRAAAYRARAEEAKTDAKTEAKTDAKTEAKTDAKTEAKTEAKTDAKTDAKPDEKPEAKTEAKPAEKVDATGAETTPPAGDEKPEPAATVDAKADEPAAESEATIEAKTASAKPSEPTEPEAKAEAKAEAEAKAKAEEKKDAPAIEYKRADASKMASAVAKEVGKTMAPTIIGIILVLALLLYFVLMR